MTNSGRRDILIRACQIKYNEKLLLDDRFLDAPRFKFGFGLSYFPLNLPLPCNLSSFLWGLHGLIAILSGTLRPPVLSYHRWIVQKGRG